jgi:hypothetical protein
MRKRQIGWKRESDSAREQGKERDRKEQIQVSRSQIGRSKCGFTSVQNFLQAP